MFKRLPRYIVPLLIVLCTTVLLPAAALAAGPVLTITGTGLDKDVSINSGDWDNYRLVERLYSSNNNYNYHKIWKVKGYDLIDLIGEGNLKSGNHSITFFASDGAKRTMQLWDLQYRYYYHNFTAAEGVTVAPMFSFYRTAVFEPDYDRLPDSVDVILENKDPTVDHDAPRLCFGQAKDQVSDKNQPDFVKKVVRIVVGEERPSDNGKPGGSGNGGGQSGGTKPGGASSGEASAKPSPSGSPAAQPGQAAKPGSETPGETGDPDAPGGETAADENSPEGDSEENGDETAAEPADEDNPDPGEAEEATDEQPRKARWPWIAAGAVVVAGAAGGGAYYYIRRRGN